MLASEAYKNKVELHCSPLKLVSFLIYLISKFRAQCNAQIVLKCLTLNLCTLKASKDSVPKKRQNLIMLTPKNFVDYYYT